LLGGPKFGFGSTKRMPKKTDLQPGPGSYKIPAQVGSVPSYSIPNRKDFMFVWWNLYFINYIQK
jgi:hypothetical protein